MSTATTVLRKPVRVTSGELASDGAGVRLRRLMGTPHSPSIDPFLMLDCFDTPDANDYLAGFPDHPHRGFETVTYMLAGRMRHRDNHGHEGVIEPGGVQWMTAGRGIVHSEMPEQTEGLMRGFQLWVNLPARLKMTAPAYQEYGPERIPVEARDGVTVKVIAGRTSRGTPGPIATAATEAFYFDIALEPGASFVEPVEPAHSAFAVVYEGALRIGEHPQAIRAVALAALGAGDAVALTAAEGPARALLIGGRPLREPVAWYGPFVMNTEREIVQAMHDYQAGRF
ncbi:MAG: pirin family protein [Pseudomonadota bacterium]|jgi:redox-sensitive bicupin YhaK (pirin superfamily)